jgi:hypothetical protein
MVAGSKKVLLLFQIVCLSIFSQDSDLYKSSTVPAVLKQNANATVRYDHTQLEIQDFDRILVKTHRIVSIYNEYGERHHNAVEFYDDKTKIKELEARIYDASGNQIKRIKERDFADESAVDGGTLYSDNRVKYLNYTTPSYPYTVEFKSEIELRSTAFVPSWYPVDDFYLSVQHSEFQIINNSGIELRTKPERFEHFDISKKAPLHYVAKNIPGIKYEVYNEGIKNIVPQFKSALVRFSMEGVEGQNNNWNDFGQWMYNKLLHGTTEIPESVVREVKALTDDLSTNKEKAKAIYKYMQEKTRYISVQVGIGGWKPTEANDVDRLGYSDCKGLTNYTRALLDAVAIPAYYTVVWGGDDIRNIDKSFSVTEGNHVILCVADEEENIFLECTSQTNPFGFTAGFTDDRDVLLITPNGGQITHTNVYNANDSQQITTSELILDETGSLKANLTRKYTGYQYALHSDAAYKLDKEHKMQHHSDWGYINALKISNLVVENDKDAVSIAEELDMTALNYASKSGARLIFQPNVFNRIETIPPRYAKRTLDFKIHRAYKDVDTYVFSLPEGYTLEAMNPSATIETVFGSYHYSLELLTNDKIKYHRTLTINKGLYNKQEYSKYRDFLKQVSKQDKTKIILLKE